MKRLLLLTFFVLTSIVLKAQVYSIPPYYMETHQTVDSLLYMQGDDSASTPPTITQLPYNWCWLYWRPAGTNYMFVCWKDTNGIWVDSSRKTSAFLTSITATAPLFSTGGLTPNISLTNGTNAQILVDSAGVKWKQQSVGGDAVMDASGSVTNGKMQGIKWKSGTPSAGQIPVYDTAAANVQWTARTLTGDIVMNDTGNVSLVPSGVSANTYGDATHTPRITVDAKGRITSASVVLITAGSVPVPLQVDSGGTGRITLTAHNVLLGNGTSAVSFATPATLGKVLTDQGASADPIFASYTNATWSGGSTSYAQATTKFFGLNGFGNGSTTDSAGNGNRTPIIQAGTIAGMTVNIRNAPLGVAQTLTFTMMKNGSAQTMAVAISTGGATTGNDLTHTFTVAAGDEVYLKCVSSATTGTIRGLEWTVYETTP